MDREKIDRLINLQRTETDLLADILYEMNERMCETEARFVNEQQKNKQLKKQIIDILIQSNT